MAKVKILYALSNNHGSKVQLERFLKAVKGKPYHIKIAAYRKSIPHNVNVDWCLDCLYNIFDSGYIGNYDVIQNFEIYYQQIKSFNPDLIISDFEHFTSYIAKVLNRPLWQCSSLLLNYSLSEKDKYNCGLYKNIYYLNRTWTAGPGYNLNIIDNSDYNFVCSHLGDAKTDLTIKNRFEWIRPYYNIGTRSKICQHNIAAATVQFNKNIINLIKRYKDSVLFSPDYFQQYLNIIMKELRNDDEYCMNVHNSNIFVCGGQANFLADAYYNGKYSLIMTDFNDRECIVNASLSEYFKLGRVVFDPMEDINKYMENKPDVIFNDKIKFLHEKIEEALK